MVFSSLFFLFIFLPANMLCYYIPSKIETRNVIMLVFSLFFYAWGEPKYVLLLLFMVLSCWFFALQIEKFRGDKRKMKLFLMIGCAIPLILLGIFKYGTFFIENFKAVTGFPKSVPEIALPIGISFYTFQLLSYVVDVYRGDACAQKRYDRLLLYASLFHQCVAGPIVRYSDIENQITERAFSVSDFNKGTMRFACGLAKKVLLANVCGSFADSLLIDTSKITDVSAAVTELSGRSALSLWFGFIFFTLQIYLDFSAYSDMAIGMGLMTGFKYLENFDYPYVSRSYSEFWRRWHISLGTFFRDYVYIPLGGNRKGKKRQIFNVLVVWLLTGFWHGASWNYVIWGLYSFVFIISEKLFLGEKLKKAPAIVSHLYTLAVIFFGWVIFKFENLSLVATAVKGLFCLNGNSPATSETFMYIGDNLLFLIIAVIATFPVVKVLKNIINAYSQKYKAVNAVYCVFRAVIPCVLVIMSAICLVGDTYNPFLYFQF